jgi:hypothetical protein
MFARPSEPVPWDIMVSLPGNPNIPPMREVMQELFTTEEMARYEAAMRPVVESGGQVQHTALAYVRARKDGGAPTDAEEE